MLASLACSQLRRCIAHELPQNTQHLSKRRFSIAMSRKLCLGLQPFAPWVDRCSRGIIGGGSASSNTWLVAAMALWLVPPLQLCVRGVHKLACTARCHLLTRGKQPTARLVAMAPARACQLHHVHDGTSCWTDALSMHGTRRFEDIEGQANKDRK